MQRHDLFGSGPPSTPALSNLQNAAVKLPSSPSFSTAQTTRMPEPPQSSSSRSQIFDESTKGTNLAGFEDGLRDDEEVEMLELEHVIGFTGHENSRLTFHYTSMGANVVIGRTNDSHSQEMLRAHDNEVNILTVSDSGLLVASAQLPSANNANSPSVIVWEFSSRKQLYHLQGFNCEISVMAFSPDDHFLVAAGKDCRILGWDMRTSEIVFAQSLPAVATIIEWGKREEKSRRPKYCLAYAYSSQLIMAELAYEIASMQYKIGAFPCAMPSTGLIREYQCCCMSLDKSILLAGTLAGEIIMFRTESRVFHGSISLSSNGILSLITCINTGCIYAGAGDGQVYKLLCDEEAMIASNSQSSSTNSTPYSVRAQVHVDGRVTSMSLRTDGQELLVGTSSGRCYCLDTLTFQVRLVSISHIAPVASIAFNTCRSDGIIGRSDQFATIGLDGSIRLWDLCDYSVAAIAHESVEGCCVTYSPFGNSIISGWRDGAIRAYNVENNMQKEWEIMNAHRKDVLSVACSDKIVVSGSSDGGVNVWSVLTRELILTFHEHKSAVTSVLIDINQSQLIHSCGADRAVYTYDLAIERRTVAHQTREGGFQAMTQKNDGEFELITGGTDGRIHVWDCDIPDPVLLLTDPNRLKINQVSVSPSGKFLITCSDDHQIKLYDMHQEALMLCCLGHSDIVTSVEWSPDERQIISVGRDCCICVWNFYGVE